MAGELATWLEGRQDEERAARELAEAAAAADDAATWLASPEGETPEATGAALTLAGLLAETPSAPLAVHRSASGLYWALVRWLHARAGRVAEATPVHEAIEALAAAGVPEARTLGEDDWFAAMERLAGDGMPWVAALVTRMKRLASTPIFRDLRPNALRNVADAVEPCTFAPGAALMREGEPGDALYVLTRGVVAISALGEDASDPDAPWTERVLTRIEVPPGEARCVGEVAVVRRADGGGRVRTASVIAETEVAALRLGADRFERLAQRDGAVAMGLVRLLSERLASATARELGHELD
jgi:CRP-like cAMP-binding protein